MGCCWYNKETANFYFPFGLNMRPLNCLKLMAVTSPKYNIVENCVFQKGISEYYFNQFEFWA